MSFDVHIINATVIVGFVQDIAAEFVLQLIKMSSNQYRSCTTGRNGQGGIFEPTIFSGSSLCIEAAAAFTMTNQL
ncbi:MAG: hypothetical protein M3136_09825 [Thermoproteota archaeon]|nr:hypothetical protein [Thermoproteota archaeon]